jgi:hypothetical protein
VTVAVYAGSSVPTAGFGAGFNFAEPAVLTLNWTQANVPLATAVTLGLLAVWIGFAAAVRRWRVSGGALGLGARLAFWGCVAAVNLVAVAQMTSHVSQTSSSNAQAASALLKASGPRPGERVAVAFNLSWPLWVPEAFEISWTELELFNPASALTTPAGVTVVETSWPAGQPAQAGWPDAPAGWRIVASDQASAWVVWRKA